MPEELSFRLLPVRSEDDLQATISLFRAYVEWVDLDLAFQGFEAEISSMPGKYTAPTGDLFLARDNNSRQAIGCVGLRALTPTVCEMKRLYVAPEGRGTGVGKALVTKVVAVARELGFEEMKLDTLPRMKPALSLYKKAGFVEIGPYYETPLEGTVFLGLKLKS